VQSDLRDNIICNLPVPKQELKELYELVSALVEPSGGETETLVANGDDNVYGDVKIYDVRNGVANDIRVSFLSALQEDDEDVEEEPIYAEVIELVINDLNWVGYNLRIFLSINRFLSVCLTA